jgi:hypothetical protein
MLPSPAVLTTAAFIPLARALPAVRAKRQEFLVVSQFEIAFFGARGL